MKNNQEPNEEVFNYSEEVQRLYISAMLSFPEIFTRCRNILKVEYWDRILRPSVKYIMDYSNQWNTLPPSEMIKAHTSETFPIYDSDTFQRQDIDQVLDAIEKFCRHKSFDLLGVDMPELIRKGLYGEIERRARENMTITLQSDLGTHFFSDIATRLIALRDKSSLVTTGWRALDDRLMGGTSLGGLILFAGQPGAGKSLMLQNIALNWVYEGLDVVYISLELKEPLIDLRVCAMASDMSTKQVINNVEDVAMKIMTQYKTKISRLQVEGNSRNR